MSAEDLQKAVRDNITPFLFGSVLIGGGGNIITSSLAPDVSQLRANEQNISLLQKEVVKIEDSLQGEISETRRLLSRINTRLSRMEGRLGIKEND